MTSDKQNIDETKVNDSECNSEEILIVLTIKCRLTLHTKKKLKEPKHDYTPYLQPQHPRHLSAFLQTLLNITVTETNRHTPVFSSSY
jgi:hypothetical protein